MAHAHGYDAWPMVQGSLLGGLAQAHRSVTYRRKTDILGDARRMGIDSADGKRGGQVALPRRLQIN